MSKGFNDLYAWETGNFLFLFILKFFFFLIGQKILRIPKKIQINLEQFKQVDLFLHLDSRTLQQALALICTLSEERTESNCSMKFLFTTHSPILGLNLHFRVLLHQESVLLFLLKEISFSFTVVKALTVYWVIPLLSILVITPFLFFSIPPFLRFFSFQF